MQVVLTKLGFRLQAGAAALAWVALGIIAGCGGGSNSGPNYASAAPGACLPSFLPNYGTKMDIAPDVVGATYLLKWAGFPLNVYITHNSYWTQSIEDAYVAGISTWTAETNGQVKWQLTTVASNAQVTVSFEPTATVQAQFQNPALLAATSDSFDAANGAMLSATQSIGIDSFQANRVTDFEQTCAHEFGHALGIAGHSPSSGDLMYYAQLTTSPGQPVQDDVDTLLGDYCNTFPVIANPAAQRPAVGRVVKTITLF